MESFGLGLAKTPLQWAGPSSSRSGCSEPYAAWILLFPGNSAVANRCNYLSCLQQRLFPLCKEFLRLPVIKITSYQLFSSQSLLNLVFWFGVFTKLFLFQALANWLIEHLEIIFLGQSQFQPETCWQEDQVIQQCYAADILCKCYCNSLKLYSCFGGVVLWVFRVFLDQSSFRCSPRVQ